MRGMIGMISFNDPVDILGMGVKNVLSYRSNDEKFQKIVTKCTNKTLVIEIKELYPVAVTVQENGTEISIDHLIPSKYDMKFAMPLKTLISIARNETGPIRAFFRGEIKVEKMWKLRLQLKFMDIFIPALRLAGERAMKFEEDLEREKNFKHGE